MLLGLDREMFGIYSDRLFFVAFVTTELAAAALAREPSKSQTLE
jgi:hypothetical protein